MTLAFGMVHLFVPWKAEVGLKTRVNALECCKEAGSEIFSAK